MWPIKRVESVTLVTDGWLTAQSRSDSRALDSFAAEIPNSHTRRAYRNAVRQFLDWIDTQGIASLTEIQPCHVDAFVRRLEEGRTAPTVKQYLAALRMLFGKLVTSQVLLANPADAVQGPRSSPRKSNTPVLEAREMRALFDSISTSSLGGLRDRALLGMMIYTFVRVGTVVNMKVCDYFIRNKRGWVRLTDPNGKHHELPCHHHLDELLRDYVTQARLFAETEGWLFRSIQGRTGVLSNNPLRQQDVYRMVRRRTALAGIRTAIGNHSLRASGITAYLRNGGHLETAQRLANHNSPLTTGLYQQTAQEITAADLECIRF